MIQKYQQIPRICKKAPKGGKKGEINNVIVQIVDIKRQKK